MEVKNNGLDRNVKIHSDKELDALNTCKEVIQYHKKIGRYPSQIDKLQSVKQLGQWLNSRRASKKGKTQTKFYPSLQKLVEESGLPDMFCDNYRELNALDMCKEVIKYYKENGKYPSGVDSNQNTKNLGNWLYAIRGYKQGKGNGIFYQSLQKLADEAGLSDMFDNVDFESTYIEICKEAIKYYKENNKYPSQIDKLQSVKQLGQWLNKMRISKKGCRGYKFYPSLQKLAEKAGLPNMFNTNWKDDRK